MAGNRWLFQGNPEVWGDLEDELSDMEHGDVSDWSVKQYTKDVGAGDDVVFWQSGKSGGLMAIGTIITDPYEGEDLEGNPILYVDWKLLRKIVPPISRSEFKESPILREMHHMKWAQATNYRVKPDEWDTMMNLIGDRP